MLQHRAKRDIALPDSESATWRVVAAVEEEALRRSEEWPNRLCVAVATLKEGAAHGSTLTEARKETGFRLQDVEFGFSRIQGGSSTDPSGTGCQIILMPEFDKLQVEVTGPDEVDVHGLATVLERVAGREASKYQRPSPTAVATEGEGREGSASEAAPTPTASPPRTEWWRDPWVVTIIGGLVVALLVALAAVS